MNQPAEMLSDQRILAKAFDQFLTVLQLADLAAGMGQDHLLETLIGFRIADDRRTAQGRSGRKAIKTLARRQRIVDQRAGRLAAEQNLVARLDKLQSRWRPVRRP